MRFKDRKFTHLIQKMICVSLIIIMIASVLIVISNPVSAGIEQTVYGSEIEIKSTATWGKLIPYDNNTVFFITQVEGNGWQFWINRTTGTTITKSSTGYLDQTYASENCFDATFLDSAHIMLIKNNAYDQTSIIGPVTNMAIPEYSIFNYDAVTSSHTTGTPVAICALNSTAVIGVYVESAKTYVKLGIPNLSTDRTTWGTAVEANGITSTNLELVTLDSDNFLLTYKDNNGLHLKRGTVTNGVVTLGPVLDVTGYIDSSAYKIGVTKFSDTLAGITYENSTRYTRMSLIDVSTDTLSILDTEQLANTGSGEGWTDICALNAISGTAVYTDGVNTKSVAFTISNGQFSEIKSPVTINSGNNLYGVEMASFDSEYQVVVRRGTSNAICGYTQQTLDLNYDANFDITVNNSTIDVTATNLDNYSALNYQLYWHIELINNPDVSYNEYTQKSTDTHYQWEMSVIGDYNITLLIDVNSVLFDSSDTQVASITHLTHEADFSYTLSDKTATFLLNETSNYNGTETCSMTVSCYENNNYNGELEITSGVLFTTWQYTFSNNGTYNITMTVTNMYGGGGDIEYANISIGDSRGFDITYTDDYGVAVTIHNGAEYSSDYDVIWVFGDGTTTEHATITTQPYTHTYATAGTYNITMWIVDNYFLESVDGLINITGQVTVPNIGYSAKFTISVSGSSATFTLIDTTNYTEGDHAHWYFGDGTAIVETNEFSITHKFNSNGIYNTSVTMVNSGNTTLATYYKLIPISVQSSSSGGSGGSGGSYTGPDDLDTNDTNNATITSYLWVSIIGAAIIVISILVSAVPKRMIFIIIGVILIIAGYYLGF